MAVEACVNPKLFNDEVDDDDDDERPLVFKRSSTSSASISNSKLKVQPISGSKRPEISGSKRPEISGSKRPEISGSKRPEISGSKRPEILGSKRPEILGSKRPDDVHSNGQKKDRGMAPPMAAKRSGLEGGSVKSPPQVGRGMVVGNLKVKAENRKVEMDSDSEDDKPLSARLSSGLPKGKGSSHDVGLGRGGASCVKKEDDDDDDDKIPLSSKFQLKLDEKKHFPSKVDENGGTDKRDKLSTVINKKRPLDGVNSSLGQSSLVKKPKTSSPLQATAKAEPKVEDDDDDDNMPISQRMKKSGTSPGNKPVPAKQKVTKVVSSTLFKKTKDFKSKKMEKNSKYSKSTKVPPSSGEGQKWSTLAHSGVIFPPSYKPHGVKMLYKGKPVDLTPEQEEVSVSLLRC